MSKYLQVMSTYRPESSRIDPNRPESTRIVLSHPESSRIAPNRSESPPHSYPKLRGAWYVEIYYGALQGAVKYICLIVIA